MKQEAIKENDSPSKVTRNNPHGIGLCSLYDVEKNEWVVEEFLAIKTFSIRLLNEKVKICKRYLVL